MDCKRFRKHHLAYLDDTMSGDMMAEAQQHILGCDPCAAHDTLVRRSLMVARSMPTIEPSAEFQMRLRAKLAACRDGSDTVSFSETTAWSKDSHYAGTRFTRFNTPRMAPRAVAAVAASVVVGTLLWRSFGAMEAPVVAMQPVIASEPAYTQLQPVYSPALISAMSTGNPVWPAALLVEDAPMQFVSSDFRLVSESR